MRMVPSQTVNKTGASRMAKACLIVLLVFCGSGATCSSSLRNPFSAVGPPAPDLLMPGASLDQVIGVVNQNSSRIVSYQTNNASLTVPGMPSIPHLRGNIAAQRPGRLHLQASTALTGPEVDLGSNDELFWFWVRRNEPPALYFSRHDQFVGSAAQQLMPIEPQWLLDALGMMQFSPNDYHEGPNPVGNGAIEIRSVMQTRTGTLTKSTLVDASKGWVLQQHIYDSTGTLLASAVARSHRYHPAMGVSLPQKVEIRMPKAQLSLSIDVGTVLLNQLADNPALWSLPAMSGYPQVDLGTAPPGAFPAMGSTGSRDWSTLASPAFVGLTPGTAIAGAQTNRLSPPVALTSPSPVVPTPNTPIVQQPVAQALSPGGIPALSGNRPPGAFH